MATLSELRNRISGSFSEQELRDLCFDLNVIFEDVPGNTRREKARELVAFYHRKNEIAVLIEKCAEKRPHVEWQDFANIEPMVSIGVDSSPSPSLSPQQIRLFLEAIDFPASLRRNRYAEMQLDVYHRIWRSLLSLKIAGDDLWEEVNHDKLIKFSQEWNDVTRVVEESAIYLEDDDEEKLKRLLKLFGQYRLGKLRLYEIRMHSREDVVEMVPASMAQRQIQQNRNHKEAYEAVLDRVKNSFRTRLSAG